MLLRTYLFFASSILLLIYLSAGVIINSNMQYFLLFMIMTVFAFVLLKNPVNEFIRVSLDLLPLFIYFTYFIVAATWALYPFQAIYFTINDLVYLMAAIFFALIARYRSFEDILKIFRVLTYSSIVVSVYMFLKNPLLNNMGGNSASIICIILPYLFISETRNVFIKYGPILISILILLVSVSRTPLVCALLGIFLTFFFTERSIIIFLKRISKFFLLIGFGILIVFVIPFTRQLLILFFFKITSIDLGYTSRILEAGEDLTRTSISVEAMNIYPQYWFQGMGYMNFMQWYGETFGVYDNSAGSKEIVGVNLHNTFETWALEGGLLCLIIICVIIWKYIARSRHKIRNAKSEYERKFHIVGLVSLIPLAVFGAFHQLHQNIIFYILIGIVFCRSPKQTMASTGNSSAIAA